jgi:hypothetical protein
MLCQWVNDDKGDMRLSLGNAASNKLAPDDDSVERFM